MIGAVQRQRLNWEHAPVDVPTGYRPKVRTVARHWAMLTGFSQLHAVSLRGFERVLCGVKSKMAASSVNVGLNT